MGAKHKENMELSTKEDTGSSTDRNNILLRISIAKPKGIRQGGTEADTREDVFLLKTSIATHKETRQRRQ